MKWFLVKSVVALILVFLSVLIRGSIPLINDKFKTEVSGTAIYHAIDKSKQTRTDVKKLIIGDSVAMQLFSCYTYNDTIYSLACNRAISMVGHFVLLQNFINANTALNDFKVYLILTPFSLANNLDQVYTFHYFLKPFYYGDNKSYIDALAASQIRKIPYYQFSQFPNIKTSNWSPDFAPPEVGFADRLLSPISIAYFQRILELSERYDFEVSLLSAPVPTSKREEIESAIADIDFQQLGARGIDQRFKYYFDHIEYLPDSLFHSDETHIHPGDKVEIDKLLVVEGIMND